MSYIDDDMKQEIISYVRENESSIDIEELLHELADASVPVYNADLLQRALDDLYLAVNEPEILAFDGKCTAVNAIAGNLYDWTLEELYEFWQSIEDDMQEEIESIDFICEAVTEKLPYVSEFAVRDSILENYTEDLSAGLSDDEDTIIDEMIAIFRRLKEEE